MRKNCLVPEISWTELGENNLEANGGIFTQRGTVRVRGVGEGGGGRGGGKGEGRRSEPEHTFCLYQA